MMLEMTGSDLRGVLGVVLAGGASLRMGRDKALLDWEGGPLVARVAARLASVLPEVVVVTKRPADLEGLGLPVVEDTVPEQTPLAGILTALRAGGGRTVFVAACDMPFVNPGLVRFLVERSPGYDAVIPVRGGRLEPLHAVWSAGALPGLERALAAGERAPHRAVRGLAVCEVPEAEWREVDPEGRSMTNLNTPGDVRAARPRSG